MTFDTPILLLAWRRPDKVAKVISSMRAIKPQNIYVACDGPIQNNPEEFDKVLKTRMAIDREIDWNYKSLKKLLSEKNKGCKEGVVSALNWFFENEEEGIIIEDDCLPHPDFFEFAKIMLNKYRNDKRIWCISGNNLQNNQKRGDASYYFSYYPLVWGWATWKRCWDKYDVEMKSWPAFKKKKLLNNYFDSKREGKYWEKRFDKMYYLNQPDTWDYQWLFCCIKNNGLGIIPNKNLIENIGFGVDATHTTSKTISPAVLKNFQSNTSGLLPIKNPAYIVRSKIADKYTSLNQFSGYPIYDYRFYIFIYKRTLNKFRSLIKSNKYEL